MSRSRDIKGEGLILKKTLMKLKRQKATDEKFIDDTSSLDLADLCQDSEQRIEISSERNNT
jgi:hypothetical protein